MRLKRIYRDAAHRRGVEMGPYPLETLASGSEFALINRLQAEPKPVVPATTELAATASWYADLFITCAKQDPAPVGEGSTDPVVRAREVKGAAYYLDAAHVGICEVPDFAWFGLPKKNADFAIVMLVEY